MDNKSSSQDNASMQDVSESAVNYQNKDVVLPNCTDLDWAQIIYAINYKRILFIHRFQTWSSFHIENSVDANTYSDYTPEELSHRFLKRVLPNIFEYELTQEEFHLLNLMDLHPNFAKTSTGFKIVEGTDNLFPPDEAAIKTLITSDVLENEQYFVGSGAKSNSQIITVGTREEHSNCRKFNFNAENAALLSVALCSDEELPNCELLAIDEIFKRLKAAKSQFENNGRQLENVSISLDDLLKKVDTLSKLKEAVAKLVDSSFLRHSIDS